MRKVKSIKDVKVGMILRYVDGEHKERYEVGKVISVSEGHVQVKLIRQTLFPNKCIEEDGYSLECLLCGVSILNDKEAVAWSI